MLADIDTEGSLVKGLWPRIRRNMRYLRCALKRDVERATERLTAHIADRCATLRRLHSLPVPGKIKNGAAWGANAQGLNQVRTGIAQPSKTDQEPLASRHLAEVRLPLRLPPAVAKIALIVVRWISRSSSGCYVASCRTRVLSQMTISPVPIVVVHLHHPRGSFQISASRAKAASERSPSMLAAVGHMWKIFRRWGASTPPGAQRSGRSRFPGSACCRAPSPRGSSSAGRSVAGRSAGRVVDQFSPSALARIATSMCSRSGCVCEGRAPAVLGDLDRRSTRVHHLVVVGMSKCQAAT